MNWIDKTDAYHHADSSIHQLASNYTQGSLDITISAINLIQQYLEAETHQSPTDYKTSIMQLLEQIKSAQPSMAFIITYVENLSYLLEHSQFTSLKTFKEKITTFHKTFLDSIKNAPYQIADHITSLIPPRAIITTFSNSSTISIILSVLKQKGKDFIVYCSESRPKYEGTMFAELLCNKKIKTVLMTDAELFSSIEETTVLLIGADTICRNGILNKIGTKSLATLADINHIPVYVACHDEKILSYNMKSPPIVTQNSTDILSQHPANLLIKNHYFDITPLSLITKVVTQSKVYAITELLSTMKNK